ncbi:MAG: glycosyl hydrolase, partial [Flavobacteriaceae bacterium]
LALLSQFKSAEKGLKIFAPEDTYYASWYSELNQNDNSFKGTHPFEGVNPANGMVLYYELPKMADSMDLRLEIMDVNGKMIRQFSSVKDTTFKKWDGGPSAEPVLAKKAGLNRFVWDLNHQTKMGVSNVYFETNFSGHRAAPGSYKVRLNYGSQTVETTGKIINTPGVEISDAQHKEYDDFMSETENELMAMHQTINSLYNVQSQLKSVMGTLQDERLLKEGKLLMEKLDQWDKEMVQRKSKAYDDVENFPNKFTAEYMFLIDQTNSAIPRVNNSSKERREELEKQWAGLKQRAGTLIKQSIPDYNQELWEAGIGALRID